MPTVGLPCLAPRAWSLVYREARTRLSNRLYGTGEVPVDHAAELPEHLDSLIAFAKAAKPDSYVKRLFAARSPDDASSAAAATPGSKAGSAAAANANAPEERRHGYGAHRATVEETRRDAANAAYAVVAAHVMDSVARARGGGSTPGHHFDAPPGAACSCVKTRVGQPAVV